MRNNYYFILLFICASFIFTNNISAQSLDWNIQKKLMENLKNEVPQKKPSNKWIERWLYHHRFYEQNTELRTQALNNFQNKEKHDNELMSNENWIPLGPVEMPVSYDSVSSFSMGRINCAAFHPLDSNIIWVASPSGGIWKTYNGGKSWQPLTDDFHSSFSSIAVSQANPDVLYAASGDQDGGGFTDRSIIGVVKSTDGGNTWKITNLYQSPDFDYYHLKSIIINPNNDDEVLVSSYNGIFKTTDGGETWELKNQELVFNLDANPLNYNVVYAALGRKYNYYGRAAILKSYDFGDTWTELQFPFSDNTDISRMEIKVSPADTSFVYLLNVAYNTSSYSGFHSLLLSQNSGESWEIMSDHSKDINILGGYNGDSQDRNGQGDYDLVLLPDPIDKAKVYTGGINIWESSDYGRNFNIVSFWILSIGKSIHPDQHFAAYNPLNKAYYFCNDGGIYKSYSLIAGENEWISYFDRQLEEKIPGTPDVQLPTVWENLSSGLAVTEFYKLGTSKNNPNYVTGGSQDNSCYYYNGNSWINYIPNYDGMETLIDNDNPEIIYGVWQNGGLCKSYDGGKTIIKYLADTMKQSEYGKWVTPIAMDYENSNILYMGFTNLWRSSDGGYHWERLVYADSMLNEMGRKFGQISIISVSTNPSHFAFVKDKGWEYDPESQSYILHPATIWTTEDYGNTWNINTTTATQYGDPISLTYDNQDPKKIWAAFSNEMGNFVVYTTNSGKDWTKDDRIISDSEIEQVQVIKTVPFSNTNALYAGTNRGIYYIDNTMQNWENISNNLPKSSVTDIEIQIGSEEIFVSTYGRGIWKTKLRTSSVEDNESEIISIKAYPNPSNGNFELIGLESISFEELKLTILDVKGREVYSQNLEAGSSKIQTKLNSGVYYLVLKTKDNYYSSRIIIKK